MAKHERKTVLFLCTGNYYRSRFAEVLFNSVAARMGLPWRASSRGLALERGINNIGPMAPSAVKALESLGFPGGAIVWLVGLVCFGIGTLIAGALPKYAGWALMLLEPSSILAALALSPIAPLLPRGAYSGNVGKGVAMGIIALGLRSVVRPKFDMPDRGD